MQIKADTATTNSSAPVPVPVPVPAVCGNCGMEERRLLHQVRHRGIFRRICTTCVLRLHPQSFCPTCFQVYPPTPSNDAIKSCSKCYSTTHSQCAEAGPAPPPNPYICPLCLHPNTPIFKLKSAKEANLDTNESMSVKSDDFMVMDKDSAQKLMAAAKIATASMNKAAVASKAEAERRAKEAAFTRKRAKESLEHVARLAMKEKLRKKEDISAASSDLTGPRLGGVSSNVGYPGGVKMEREYSVNGGSYSRNGSLALPLGGPSMAVEKKINSAGNVNVRDNSNQVLAALNAVELRENEKTGSGVAVWNVGSGASLTGDNNALMDVDEKGENVEGFVGERNSDSGSDHLNLADIESGAETLNTEEEKLEDVSKEEVLLEPVVDQIQFTESINGVEQHANDDAPL